MSTVTSRDGTTIGYTRTGEGPPVILVDGALCHRGFGPAEPLAKLLAKDFTVYTYDRRGRGESGDTPPYAVRREIEDLEAVMNAAGGSAYLYGISSGAALAIEAANHGLPVKRLAVYEPPFIVDDTRPAFPEDGVAQLNRMIAAGRRGEAVASFMKQVEAPGFAIFMMRLMPVWRKLKAVAHTLPYDFTIMEGRQQGRPLRPDQWAGATVPTLVLDGGKSPAWMRNGNRAAAEALPNARYDTIEGQNHMLKPEAIAPLLVRFFAE